MFRIARYSAAVVVLLSVLFICTSWLLDRSASTSFAEMVENVKNAKTVSFVIKEKTGDQPGTESKMFIKGNFMRYEESDGNIAIVHLDQKKARELSNPIEQLRSPKADAKDHVKILRDEELDGRKCHVYEIKGLTVVLLIHSNQFKLWADVKTELPVKIHFMDEHTSVTYEDFQWDEPLNDNLFRLEVPGAVKAPKLEK